VNTRAEGVRLAHPLFQAEGGGETPTSALQLWFAETDASTAIALNRLWHSRLPVVRKGNVVGGFFFVAEFDGLYFASAIWTNPVARLLPQKTWLELRRMAIAPDAPKNTASRMLGWMTRHIRKRRPQITTLVSYQDKEVHTGTIYRASGWQPVTLADPRSRPWNNTARGRNKEQSTAPKQRWEKVL